MKQTVSRASLRLLLCLLMCGANVFAENVFFGNYTGPAGYKDGDMIIIGGNLSLSSSFTVNGDLKINGGYVSITNGDLHVTGDLIVTNTNTSGTRTARINISNGELVVTGEIFTKSDAYTAHLTVSDGIRAGRIETYGNSTAYIYSSAGSIDVEEDIIARSNTHHAYVKAGADIRAAGIYTFAGSTYDGYVSAGYNIDVKGNISTNAVGGDASVYGSVYLSGGVKAGAIFANGYEDAIILTGNSFIDVIGDIVLSNSMGSSRIAIYNGHLKSGNISVDGWEETYISARDFIHVVGDISTMTHSDVGGSFVVSQNEDIKAKSISTNGPAASYVEGETGIDVSDEICTRCRLSGDARVRTTAGVLHAGRIRTFADDGIAYVSAGGGGRICVDGSIITESLQSSAYVSCGMTLSAGSIFTQGDTSAYVRSINDDVIVQDEIYTKGGSGAGYVKADGDIMARSIFTEGSTAYVEADNGSIRVTEDIHTLAKTSNGYVSAVNGDIIAQKIKTEAPTGQDDSILAAPGSMKSKFIPTIGDAAKIIKDAEFSFNADHDWNTQMELRGSCTINGNGHVLTFDANGGITVATDAKLLLKNIKIRDLFGSAISCFDDSGEIKVNDVVWTMTDDFVFAKGSIEVIGDFLIDGPGTQFNYDSIRTSTINPDGKWIFGRDVTLDYDTASSGRIYMVDSESRLNFDGATLNASEDIRFTNGTLVFDNYVIFNAPVGKTIYFGNGVLANNINYEPHVASQFNVTGAGSWVNVNA